MPRWNLNIFQKDVRKIALKTEGEKNALKTGNEAMVCFAKDPQWLEWHSTRTDYLEHIFKKKSGEVVINAWMCLFEHLYGN